MPKVPILKIFLLFVLFNLVDQISSQELNLSGLILDAKTKQGIEEVIVTNKNSNQRTTSNTLGEFILPFDGVFPISIEISLIGFTTQELLINSNEKIIVELVEKSQELEEVIIVSGYNNIQKKRDFTGSVSNISSKQFLVRPSSSFDQLLGGMAAGVDVIQPSNILNNTPVMRIRGINSITSGIFPLIVIDGVPLFTGAIGGIIANNPLSDINPNDIQSIDVLKDASSASIFGSRASNGVMVVTTKKGKKGRVKVNYNAWISRSTPFNLPELLNAEQYVMIKNEAMKNSGREPGYKLMYNADSSIVNTNWYDVAYRPGYSHAHHLSFAGANNSTNYYFSFGYDNQNSFIKTNNFERYSTRLNIENQVNKYLKAGAHIAYSNGFNTGPMTGAVPSNTLSSSAYNSQYILNEPLARMTYVLPTNVPLKKADGSYSIQNGQSVGYGLNNPSTIGTINAYNLGYVLENDYNTSENNNLSGNIFGELQILSNLKFRTSFSLNNLLVENNSFMNPIHGGGFSSNGVATNTITKLYRKNLINLLTYSPLQSENHKLNISVGHEQISTTMNSWGAERSNITDPYYNNYQGGFVNISPIGNVFTENNLLSFFAYVNYELNRKYFISLNGRRDGLSALSEGNKFGNFGGASAGWNIHNEDFFINSSLNNIFSNVRIRASYGLVGNSEIGDYPSIGAYTSATYGGEPTLRYSQVSNPDLRWETSKKLDLGMNIGLLKERIQIDFDFFRNNIDGLILRAPQSLSAGIPGSFINANVGEMYNTGIELGINSNLISNNKWRWDFGFNCATLKNEVTKLVSDVYVPSIFGVHNMTREGYSIGSIFAVKTKGVNPDNGLMVFYNSEGKEVQYNHIGSPRWTYLDGTPAPAIDNYRDGVIIGSSLPKWFGGINSNLNYRNWELNVNFTFAGGHYLYNGTRATNSDQRYFNNGTFILDRWTTPGQKTEIQKLQYGDNVSAGFSFSATSKVEKADYLKLKNIVLAYNIPLKNKMLASQISSIRTYIQAVNVLTFTNYRGSDPEVSINGNSIHSGKDQNVPPNAQVISFGINVGF
ncbi:MAG: SusC/RagA family TonB-linked outer membrane protein [Saprospiraceae bacterium]|nr:SusC/RagA family TonB-linked outer membrane protein [Saprospiraceae bacterium]